MLKKCYIYTRVSTASQVDGYSLDAQMEALRNYVEYREWKIVGEYCDAGISGKTIKNRPEFRQMMDDVMSQKDDVEYILVFKLSRFGRNAADILRSVQILDDYGVNLVSVNEGIDSSTPGGKLTLTILSAVAEMEHENITVQFFAGKYQKILNGDWGGGTIPYGYRNIEHKLVLDPYESEVIQKIFELYLEEGSSASSVAVAMNESSYERRDMKNGGIKLFDYEFISRTIDNPFYCGRLCFNRRTNKKDRNGKVIKYDAGHAIMVPGNHEAIVTEEVWDKAHEKRIQMAQRNKKSSEKVYVHILSGLIKCPVCGKHLVGQAGRTKKINGEGFYKPSTNYMCRHSKKQNACICSYTRKINQEILDGIVFEILSRLQFYDEFKVAMEKALCMVDSVEQNGKKLKELRVKLRDAELSKNKIGEQLDALNPLKEDYDKKYEVLSNKLDKAYDLIDELEDAIKETKKVLDVMQKKSDTFTNIIVFLENLKVLLEKMTADEKKELCNSFIKEIEIFKEDRSDGKIVKSITFKFPLAFDGKEFLQVKDVDDSVSFTLNCEDIDVGLTAESGVILSTMEDGSKKVIVKKPTYSAVKKYVKEKYGANVHTLYIAQTKRKYGLDVGKAYNKKEESKNRVPHCPPYKEKMILEALKYLGALEESIKYKEGE